jgi:mitogen-activated protein kinase 6
LLIFVTKFEVAECSVFFSPFLSPVEGALAHPYLASLHDISDEPVCSMPFSFDFEQHALSEEQMKDLIYQEALAFNPDYQ